jgi:hypothetical protein
VVHFTTIVVNFTTPDKEDSWDFNADGADDLLVAVRESATQGSFAGTRLVLLTRLEAGAKLSTVKRLQ